MKLRILLGGLGLFFAVALQAGINDARPGSSIEPSTVQLPLAPPAANSGSEGFDDISNLPGWDLLNVSNPLGVTDWFQGNNAVFSSHSGVATSYIAANFNNTAGNGDISNWLILPDLGRLASVSFFTRTTDANVFPDRLEIRLSPSGGANVGNGLNDVGDFTVLLGSINPALQVGGYPQAWTEFSYLVNSGGRVALRYSVSNAGPAGANSNYIGIDDVSWVLGRESVPVPSLQFGGILLLMLLMGVVGAFKRKKRSY